MTLTLRRVFSVCLIGFFGASGAVLSLSLLSRGGVVGVVQSL